jgi:protein-L-isoaspartate(D-aspartate) O-methyltransferase
MVRDLMQKGISDEAVLEAMRQVPRHGFVAGGLAEEAYQDKALPIASGQTISQPFTVAFQSQLLQAKPGMKVLEIGTGSGYQAAVLCQMGLRVVSVEIDRRLYLEARERLAELGCEALLFLGDGSVGWSAQQPYDRILITAATPEVPLVLKQQLALGGRLVAPVGGRQLQQMTVVSRLGRTEYEVETLQGFRFVPLRGKYGYEQEAG